MSSFTRLGRALLLVACFIFTLGASHEGCRSAAGPEAVEWTLMYFMDADNDLELPQMENILAMSRVSPSESVRVLLLVDRSKESNEEDNYTDMSLLNLKNWTGAKLFEVQKGKVREIEDMGELNMGDPVNLVTFVEKASTLAPASKYCLIFGDHGASWPGFNSDGSHDGDSITLEELQGALKTITSKLGRIELIHYDDCLMSCVESAEAIAPYTKWITASAELVPGEGCDYEAIMSGLNADPSMDGEGLGRIIVKTFRDFYEKANDESRKGAAAGITMALIDCDEMEALSTEMANLASKTSDSLKSGGRASYLKAAKARADVTEYGRGSGDDEGSGVVDVIDYCRLLQKQYGAGPVGGAAENVITQVKRAVKIAIHGKALPQSRGISVYLPLEGSSLSGDGNTYAGTPFAVSSGWGRMISTFLGDQAKDRSDPGLQRVAATSKVIKPDGEVTFTSKLQADDLDEAYFTIAMEDGEDRIIVGQVPSSVEEGGLIKEAWDGQWLYLHNGKEQMICPIDDIQLLDEDNPDGELIAIVPIQIRQSGKGEWIDLTATFILDFTDDEGVTGELIYAFRETMGGSRQMEIDKGDVVRPVFLVVDKDGNEDYVAAEGSEFEMMIDDANGLAISEDRVPDGEYLMGFRVVDFAGNAAEEFTKVTVAPPAGRARR